jgi:hypothetical protein
MSHYHGSIRHEVNIFQLIFTTLNECVGFRPTLGLLSLANKESNQRNWPWEIFIRLFAQLKESNITPPTVLLRKSKQWGSDTILLYFTFRFRSSPKISKGNQIQSLSFRT